MSDYRNDSYQEMKALLNERLDSIVGEREDEEQEQESGAKKWGKRAAKVALGAGVAVGAAYGGKKALGHFAAKNPANKGLKKWNRRINGGGLGKTLKRKAKIARAPKVQGPRAKSGNFY